MTLKVLSLFSGIGAFESALKNNGTDFELVGYSEIDKYAIESYKAIHNVSDELNFGDVSKIDKHNLPDFDLLVGGSPCQSFSVAGKRKGFEDTRGTLFFEYAETLKIKQPKYFLYENVKGLVNHDKGITLDTMIQVLSDAGYTLDFNVLNSKYFNVPQNRERIYIVGILNHPTEKWSINKRKNIVDKGKLRLIENVEGIKTFNYDWPKEISVNKRLKDILEINVDERYYLSDDKTAKLIKQMSESEDLKQIGYIGKNVQGNRVYSIDGIGATVSSSTGGLGGKGVTLTEEQDDRFLIDDQGRTKKKLKPLDISPTLRREMHGNEPRVVEPKVHVHNIPQMVKVRKYEVDIDGLRTLLRNSKKVSGLTNRKISEVLSRPITEVEHWFRTDNCFSIPSPELWFELKELLKITTNEFDVPITEFEIREGTYEKSHRCYDVYGLSPTLTSTTADEKIVEPLDVVKSCSTRTRSYAGQPERLEVRDDEVSNSITSVPKDSYVLRIPQYRIRKLTPLECFRLQAFTDEDFKKCKEVGISDTQLYKQSGNSITVTVLEEILKNISQ